MKSIQHHVPLLTALFVAGLAIATFGQPPSQQPLSDPEGHASPAIQLLEAEVQAARTRAALVRAETQVEMAKKGLDEYQKGRYEIQRAALAAEMASAEENARLAQDRLTKLKEGAKKKDQDASRENIDKAQFACWQAENARAQASLRRHVLDEYTRPMELYQVKGAIDVAQAELEAAQAEHRLATARLDHLKSAPERRAASDAGNSARTASKPVPTSAEKPRQPIGFARATVDFEAMKSRGGPFQTIYRAKVPEGWLVGFFSNHGDEGLIFYPDPDHKWECTGMQ